MATKPHDLARTVDGDVDRLVMAYASEGAAIRAARGPVMAGMAVRLLAGLVVALVVLAGFSQIDRIVETTHGVVVTVKPNISLQALESSMIKTIDVSEGQFVKAGQELMTMDPTFVDADTTALQAQVAGLRAQIERNEAELAGRPLAFQPAADPSLARYQALQLQYYAQRKAQYDQQIKAFDAQIAESRTTIERLKAERERLNDRSAIAGQIETMWTGLQARDAGSLLQTLNAKDLSLQIHRDIDNNAKGIEEAQHRMEAVVANREAFIQSWLGQSSQELMSARGALDGATEQLTKAARRADLVRLVAPEDAIVLTLPKLSVGSVIKQGDTMAMLAPMSAPLEVEVGISPRDIGFVRAGDRVTLKLDAFQFIEHGTAEGRIRWISEGTFAADGSAGSAIQAGNAGQEPYYKARVEVVSVDFFNVPQQFRLLPGMTLAAEIHVGKRRLLSYLLRGIVRTSLESMREPR